ncbi:hypothetical protein BX661DRAFT_172651 [Kickxella alabastrina]|uniref:uncharacterized protein n=1 Tax=Kickxella alabastrina TaxID=61397 RepID=UPI002220EB15|nr:uncharacterized protein BX661DRAFT_172651 [Kickxella alabastrina]KAI7823652.1 hypothetical protein BX661DRAFT_172651 [Kickxella alabastrina]
MSREASVITSLIEMEDAEIISYLKNIEIQRSTDNPINYNIVFLFEENPYFTNSKLIKEFDFSDKGNIKVVNHKIDWKANMDLTAVGKKTDVEEEGDEFSENEDASFFCWFNDANGSDLADLIANDLFPNADMYFIDSEDSEDEESPIFELGESDVEEEVESVSDNEVENAPASKRAGATKAAPEFTHY